MFQARKILCIILPIYDNYVTLFVFLLFTTVILQEAYSMLNKFDVSVSREEVERVDTLRYSFEKLLGQAVGIQLSC